MNQCKIIANHINQDESEPMQIQSNLCSFESFQNLNNYEFEIPHDCNTFIRTLFVVGLINLDYNKEEVSNFNLVIEMLIFKLVYSFLNLVANIMFIQNRP